MWHTLTKRSADWVPTGAIAARSAAIGARNSGKSPARIVTRIAAFWLTATTGAAVIALVADISANGPHRFWGVAAYVAVTGYLTVPLIRELTVSLRPSKSGTAPMSRRTTPALQENSK